MYITSVGRPNCNKLDALCAVLRFFERLLEIAQQIVDIFDAD